jgi:hypothetical protein
MEAVRRLLMPRALPLWGCPPRRYRSWTLPSHRCLHSLAHATHSPPPLPHPHTRAQILPYATLGNWLLVVASLRLLSVVLGYTYPAAILGQNLETQLFDRANTRRDEAEKSKTAKPVANFTPLAARNFAAWTTVTCLVCVATYTDPGNKTLLVLTLSTFLVAMLYFVLEFGVYGTVSFRTVSRPAFFAGGSLPQRGGANGTRGAQAVS